MLIENWLNECYTLLRILCEVDMSKDKFGLAQIKAEGRCRIYDKNDDVASLYDFESIKIDAPEFKILDNNEGYHSYGPAPTTQYVCHCGSKDFTVHYQSGGYETSIICLKCKEAYIVHEG